MERTLVPGTSAPTMASYRLPISFSLRHRQCSSAISFCSGPEELTSVKAQRNGPVHSRRRNATVSLSIERWRGQMAAQKIDRPAWQAFFDTISKGLVGVRAEIEVASLALGDQIEAEWLPLLGITYDPKDDVLEIALGGLDHLIPRPQELYADAGAGALLSFEVIDGDGASQIIMLREPLMLLAPSSTTG
jgi:hypothetical protein